MADESFFRWHRSKSTSSDKQSQKQSWTYNDSRCVTHSIEFSRKVKRVNVVTDDCFIKSKPAETKPNVPGETSLSSVNISENLQGPVGEIDRWVPTNIQFDPLSTSSYANYGGDEYWSFRLPYWSSVRDACTSTTSEVDCVTKGDLGLNELVYNSRVAANAQFDSSSSRICADHGGNEYEAFRWPKLRSVRDACTSATSEADCVIKDDLGLNELDYDSAKGNRICDGAFENGNVLKKLRKTNLERNSVAPDGEPREISSGVTVFRNPCFFDINLTDPRKTNEVSVDYDLQPWCLFELQNMVKSSENQEQRVNMPSRNLEPVLWHYRARDPDQTHRYMDFSSSIQATEGNNAEKVTEIDEDFQICKFCRSRMKANTSDCGESSFFLMCPQCAGAIVDVLQCSRSSETDGDFELSHQDSEKDNMFMSCTSRDIESSMSSLHLDSFFRSESDSIRTAPANDESLAAKKATIRTPQKTRTSGRYLYFCLDGDGSSDDTERGNDKHVDEGSAVGGDESGQFELVCTVHDSEEPPTEFQSGSTAAAAASIEETGIASSEKMVPLNSSELYKIGVRKALKVQGVRHKVSGKRTRKRLAKSKKKAHGAAGLAEDGQETSSYSMQVARKDRNSRTRRKRRNGLPNKSRKREAAREQSQSKGTSSEDSADDHDVLSYGCKVDNIYTPLTLLRTDISAVPSCDEISGDYEDFVRDFTDEKPEEMRSEANSGSITASSNLDFPSDFEEHDDGNVYSSGIPRGPTCRGFWKTCLRALDIDEEQLNSLIQGLKQWPVRYQTRQKTCPLRQFFPWW